MAPFTIRFDFAVRSLLALLLASSWPVSTGGQSVLEQYPELPSLSHLSVTGAGTMRPEFAPNVFHYAIRCGERQTLTVSAGADANGSRLRLNGQSTTHPLADAPVTLAEDEDLIVEVEATGTDERTAYIVHCVPPDFPDVEVLRKEPGTAPGLLLVTPYYNVSGADVPSAWLAMLDDNGVPRFARRVAPAAHNFRWHGGARRFSYNEAAPNGAGDVVLLDERLREVRRVGTVGGLAPAMMHEFLITDEGNYLFIANNPALRDFSRYPGRDGGAAPSSAQETLDAVIQEVAPDGREVFRWNAWEHLQLSDCLGWWGFPGEYAKLNSLHIADDGNIVASFRACSVVLKIEHPSGRVLWQLGGSNPAAPDPHDDRRPTFDRPWFQVAGDPRGGFCAQHSVLETEPGRILMFDNGQCASGDRSSSRVVEYRLGGDGKAAFLRHHEPGRQAVYGGAVAPLPNGNWLVSWGAGPGDATLSEVNPAGRELFALSLGKHPDAAMSYRAFRHDAAQAADTTGQEKKEATR